MQSKLRMVHRRIYRYLSQLKVNAGAHIEFPIRYSKHVTAACLLTFTLSVSADAEPFEFDPQSSTAMKNLAIRELPLDMLNESAQTKVHGVVSTATYFRRLPEKTIECDADLFTEMVRYPEILVSAWDLMGVTKVEIQRIAPFVFRGDDKAGTKCVTELLLGNETTHVYYATGDYTGKLVPRTLNGRSVCVLHSNFRNDANGQPIVTAHMDIFLKLDNIGADLMLRTLSPLVGKTADQNYSESLRFIAQFSKASIQNPGGVRNLVERMRMVDSDVKTQFIRSVYESAERVAQADDEIAQKTKQIATAPENSTIIIGR